MTDMIDAETTMFVYEYYVNISIKREQAKSNNQIFG